MLRIYMCSHIIIKINFPFYVQPFPTSSTENKAAPPIEEAKVINEAAPPPAPQAAAVPAPNVSEAPVEAKQAPPPTEQQPASPVADE